MALFTVLEPPDGKPDRVVVIPEGFAWAAAVFTFLWAFWHRMWLVGALLFTAYAALTIAASQELISGVLASAIQFGLSFLFGLEARCLRVMALERAGFRRSGLIQASRLEAAELAYFAGRAPSPPVPATATARYRAGPDDTLGIFGNV